LITFRLFGSATPLDARPDPRDPEGKRSLPPPEWGEIKNRSIEALREEQDIRLLAHLGTASLRTDGLPGFAAGLAVTSQWLETYWAQTYPLVDEDAILRRNALNCLRGPDGRSSTDSVACPWSAVVSTEG
jgi:type VI secretion system protein ImpA